MDPIPGGDPQRVRFHHDRAYRGSGAGRSRNLQPRAFTPDSDPASCGTKLGFKGDCGYRCTRDGRDRARIFCWPGVGTGASRQGRACCSRRLDGEAAINAVEAAVRKGRSRMKRIRRRVTANPDGEGSPCCLAVKKLRWIWKTSIPWWTRSRATLRRAADQRLIGHAGQERKRFLMPISIASATTAFFVLTDRARFGGSDWRSRRKSGSVPPAAPASRLRDTSDVGCGSGRGGATCFGGQRQYVVAAFASVAAYRGNVALGGGFPAMPQNLVATKKPVALVALGNPYLLRCFPDVSAYMTTYSFVQHPSGDFPQVEGAVLERSRSAASCQSVFRGLRSMGMGSVLRRCMPHCRERLIDRSGTLRGLHSS